MTNIHRSAYDFLYDNNWNQNKSVHLWNDRADGVPPATFEELVEFAQFMVGSLGFRLKMTFPYGDTRFVRLKKVD